MSDIQDQIRQVVKDLFDVDETIDLTRTDEQFGDYATNIALRLSKRLGQKPPDVAQKIIDKLDNPAIAKAEIAGPGFINIWINSNFLAQWLNTAIKTAPNSKYGSSLIGKGQTVVCEFPSPNMAKPLSVGHIRAALQGWAMAQLMNFTGHKVITDNHIGDVGTPFGKWVVGYLRYSSPEKLQKDGINELSRVYIAITADMKAEKEQGKTETDNEVQSWLQKLEAGDAKATELSKKFNQISIDHMHDIMRRLGISTEYEYGESKFVKRGQELADELLKAGVAKLSDGAIIVELDDQGIDTPVMLRKANGTALYATTDLATIEFRQKNWHPDKVFIHTGEEQSFYFRQLGALARKAGFDDNIVHLWHGLVDQVIDGKREKMSSRKGVVMLSELLDKAEDYARAINKEGKDEDIRKIALGAVKFTEFTADRRKGLLFDWDNIFNVQGFSGPAVQYAGVRINSIIKKADNPQLTYKDDGYDWQNEHQLLLDLLDFPPLIEEIAQNYELHKLAAYLYQLTRALNRYYENSPILKAENSVRQQRLWLISAVKEVLSNGLNILGISLPDKM
jgi:arginyl-tRNA synthetase